LVINLIYFLIYKNKNDATSTKLITAIEDKGLIKDDLIQTQITPLPINSTQEVIETTPTPGKNKNIRKSAWIPSFDSANGLSSFIKNKKELSTIHYASGTINAGGQPIFVANTDQTFASIQKEDIPFGVNIIFSDYNGTNLFLNNQSFQTTLQNKIIDFKKYKNFKSINLNIEKVKIENKADLEEYLRTVREFTKLQNLELYITIFPKTESSKNNTSTEQALDYKILNEVGDKVILMAYDYKTVKSGEAKYDFANSPNGWMEDIIRYAKKDIEGQKLIIGLPLYGYGFNKNTKSITKSYTYSQIESIIKSEKLTPQLDMSIGEMRLERANEIIIYQSKESLDIKHYIIQNLGVNEVFYWRLGGEGSLDY
jgi:spore germination protein YaaH